MQMDLQDIEARLKSGYMISDQERAFLIRNNPHALAAFMIANNPGSVNYRLKERWGYNHLGFEPDPKKLIRQLDINIDRGDWDVLEDLAKNFNVVPDGLPPTFVQELYKQFNN